MKDERNGRLGEWCERCHRRVAVGFDVPDQDWKAIVRGRFGIVCLPCFDQMSEGTGIRWEEHVELFPVSAATWAEHEEAPCPTAS